MAANNQPMRDFDLYLSWYWLYDDDFVHHIEPPIAFMNDDKFVAMIQNQ